MLAGVLEARRLVQGNRSWGKQQALMAGTRSIGTVGRPRKNHTCSYTWLTKARTRFLEIKGIRKTTSTCKSL